jgi:hypothetical protein
MSTIWEVYAHEYDTNNVFHIIDCVAQTHSEAIIIGWTYLMHFDNSKLKLIDYIIAEPALEDEPMIEKQLIAAVMIAAEGGV